MSCAGVGSPAAPPVTGSGGAGGAAADSGPTPQPAADGGGGSVFVPDAGPDAGPTDAGPTLETVLVYAHTSSQLYTVDPQALKVTLVGPFIWPPTSALTTSHSVTDIAVDHQGGIVGLTFTDVIRVDARTAACTIVAPLNQGSRVFNGLSWVRTGDGLEILLATVLDGTVWRIDPTTGGATMVGSFGQGLGSSGDLVSVAKYGTLATVKRANGGLSDWLARIDPATGAATLIGAIGFNNVWGIGFWGDRVFGFGQDGQFILINPDTGQGTLTQNLIDTQWYGAGVSTSVFVIP